MSVSQQPPRAWLVWLLALLPVLGAYSNVLGVGFMWDDHVLIEQNSDLHVLHAPWDYLGRSFWQHPFMYGTGHAFYRPLVTASLALDWSLGGGSPAFFHFTNLLLHLAVASFVFLFAWKRGGDVLTAGVVTALFGVMPRLTESVTWIVGRTDVLAALLVFAALWLVEVAPQKVRPLAGVLLFFGLLAKEVAIIGVLVLVTERVFALTRRQSTRARELPLFIATFVAVAAWWFLRAQHGGSQPLSLHGLTTFFAGVGHYALMLLTPWNPTAQIGFILEPEGWAVALGVVASALVAFAAVRWLRSEAPWRAAWLGASFGGVVLVSLVVLTVYTIASDRFLYLPLAFAAPLAAQRAWPRSALVVGALAGVVLAAVTWQRNELWADPLRFWADVYRTASPRNPGAAAGLGDALFELGRFDEARRFYVEAEAARGRQADSPTRLSLAVVDSKRGLDAQALAALQVILDENPGWRRAWYDLVLFRARAGDLRGAREALVTVRARFGDDDVLRGFETTLSEVEQPLASGTALEQARAFHKLGATTRAEQKYLEVLDSGAARTEAAQWLVVFASEASARRGLEALGDDPAAQATWHERFGTPPLTPR